MQASTNPSIDELAQKEAYWQRRLEDSIEDVKRAEKAKAVAFSEWMEANKAHLRAKLEAELKESKQ